MLMFVTMRTRWHVGMSVGVMAVIMQMRMFVFKLIVAMGMFVLFGNMQKNTYDHEYGGGD